MPNSGLKYLIYPLFCFINYFALYAQSDEQPFDKLNIEIDGELIIDVHFVEQDHQGYIWMNTNLGLIRYNGIEGEKFSNNINGKSYPKDEVFSLFVDSSGDMWVGYASGLSKFDTLCNCITQFPPTASISNSNSVIVSMAEDKSGDLWLGTMDGVLYTYSKKK